MLFVLILTQHYILLTVVLLQSLNFAPQKQYVEYGDWNFFRVARVTQMF